MCMSVKNVDSGRYIENQFQNRVWPYLGRSDCVIMDLPCSIKWLIVVLLFNSGLILGLLMFYYFYIIYEKRHINGRRNVNLKIYLTVCDAGFRSRLPLALRHEVLSPQTSPHNIIVFFNITRNKFLRKMRLLQSPHFLKHQDN